LEFILELVVNIVFEGFIEIWRFKRSRKLFRGFKRKMSMETEAAATEEFRKRSVDGK
jgi:hypothetical protein